MPKLPLYILNETLISKRESANDKPLVKRTLTGNYCAYFVYRIGSDCVCASIENCSFWLAQQVIECPVRLRKMYQIDGYLCELDWSYADNDVFNAKNKIQVSIQENRFSGYSQNCKTKVLLKKGICHTYERHALPLS